MSWEEMMNAPWMLIANYLKGVTEAAGAMTDPKIREMFRISGFGGVQDDETPWCAAFVGTCLRLSGLESSNRLNARSYNGFGEKLLEPKPGCIVVFWRESKSSEKGHVAFFDHSDRKFIYTLGGNQGDAVTIKGYDKNRLIGYFWPFKTTPLATSPLIPNIDQLTMADSEGESQAPTPVDDRMANDLSRAAVPNGDIGASPAHPSNFGKVQPIIDKWEGGYVDNPQDPGGATNMGVTIGTLSRWRGRQVSKDEVKALTRDEVWKIMKAYYYDLVRGDDLPLPVAVAAHNAAVLSGPSASARFLQRALVQMGIKVTVDGAIGRETTAAVATVDSASLAKLFFDLQEAFYRGLPRFPVFGRGWLNRLNDVRRFAMQAQSEVIAIDDLETPAPVPIMPRASNEVESAAVSRDLTPVNAALGETVGKYLDGRKTGLGTLGLLATSLVYSTAPHVTSGVIGALDAATPYATPIAGALAAWGLLGKVDKWVNGVRQS
jgi:uncharacterized protein (TIGR02594 family)